MTRRQFLQSLGVAATGTALGLEPHISLASPESTPSEYQAFLQYVAENPRPSTLEDYYDRLESGIGYGTYHRRTEEAISNQGRYLRTRMGNSDPVLSRADLSGPRAYLYDLTEGEETGVRSRLVDQEGWSELDALRSGTYTGIMGLCSPKNIGCRYLVYRVSPPDPGARVIDFLGVGIVGDCLQKPHWDNDLVNSIYEVPPWQLWWLADLDERFALKIPTGFPGDNDLMRGRPGVMLIAEELFWQYHGAGVIFLPVFDKGGDIMSQ